MTAVSGGFEWDGAYIGAGFACIGAIGVAGATGYTTLVTLGTTTPAMGWALVTAIGTCTTFVAMG